MLRLLQELKLSGNTDDELINSLTDMIRDLNEVMNIPFSFAENGMTKEEFDENVDFIAENALKDACTGSNPRPINVCEMKKLLTCAFTGEKVNF